MPEIAPQADLLKVQLEAAQREVEHWTRRRDELAEQLTVQRVVDLWNAENGWIPGAAYRELAAALGIEAEVFLEIRKTRK